MGKKIKVSGIVVITLFVFIFTFFIIQSNKEQDTLQASSTVTLSNKKIGWGIKRAADHVQPDLGSKNKEIIDIYKGIAMGNSQKKYVYLTFDEGYEAGYTPRILQVLKENDVKATFFLTAHFVNTQEQLVRDMIEGRTRDWKPYCKPQEHARFNR